MILILAARVVADVFLCDIDWVRITGSGRVSRNAGKSNTEIGSVGAIVSMRHYFFVI